MEQNKTGKYLKYAIGEIVLVVIGILIALGINNWNENRKTRNEQDVFLSNIMQELKEDLIQIDWIVEHQSYKLNKTNGLISELKTENSKDFQTIETLYVDFSETENDTFFPNTGTYSTTGSEDILGNLKPESLKIAITNLYERFYYRLTYNGQLYDQRDMQISFERGKYYNKITRKLNSLDVIEDTEFSNLITIISDDNAYYLKLCITTKEEIQKVIELINNR
jgi:hypothetical protein